MDYYIVVSEIEFKSSTSHRIHCISNSIEFAEDVYERVDRKEYHGVLLLKIKNDKVLEYEFFGLSNYDEDVQIVKAYPNWNMR